MTSDSLLVRVAGELGVSVIGPLTGGEFGATLVRDETGCELVLKALPSPAWAPKFALGAELAERLRMRSYPVPRYRGTGIAAGASWSLQERVTGEVPERMSEAHARRLLALAPVHAGAAGRRNAWDVEARASMR